MRDIKIGIAIFSMVLIFILIASMLWNKNAESRIKDMKQISDYIVEVNFKYQKEREEAAFIKMASLLENKMESQKGFDAGDELLMLRSTALSLAPYSTELSLHHKLTLIKCLEDYREGKSRCSIEYATKQVKKAN